MVKVSYLVYILTITCMVGKRVCLLLFVFPCDFSFFFLSSVSSKISPQQHRKFIFGIHLDNVVLWDGEPAFSF